MKSSFGRITGKTISDNNKRRVNNNGTLLPETVNIDEIASEHV